ncbi:hypothetical protein NF212_25410 (plasmid) [Parasalinivibrio latis]|uniref:ribonuclease T2 family protein n=1 Tax=Parasalinivibrio latis TaxID=2952610 RepID=UPI0030E2ECFF
MKSITLFLMTLAFATPAIATPGTFTAEKECPYANRIKQLTDDGLPTLQVGKTYRAIQYNNSKQEFIRISIEKGKDKWTRTECGKPEGAISAGSSGSHYSNHKPGDFAYYKLALSYSQEFCIVKDDLKQDQCSREWIVHGLWPQNKTGWPRKCKVSPEMEDEINKAEIYRFMPSDYLIGHEWIEHGTCSGLTRSAYYALTGELWDTLKLPDLNARDYTKDGIKHAVTKLNPQLTDDMIELACDENGGPKETLDEIRVCFTKDKESRPCSEFENSCRNPIKVREIENIH